MKAQAHVRPLAALARFLWAATLLTLPVTSFRYFPAGEGTYVRPLAVLPLVLLLATLLLQLLKGQIGPPAAPPLVPFAVFLLICAATSALGIGFDPLPMRGQEAASRVLRAWATVLVGAGFFLGAIWMNRDERSLRFSVRWLLFGFVADVFWSGVQGATFYLQVLPKPLVTHWQRLFSLRELIRTNRISGMAYEPAWLAGQIATVYLPWLTAAVLTKVRMTRYRWFEPCLLIAALALVLATFSRGGILTALVSAGLGVVLAGRSELCLVWKWLTARVARPKDQALRLGVTAVLLTMVAGAGFLLAQRGYISRLWDSGAADLPDFLVRNSAGARGAYLSSGLEIYQEFPWTGVGLGASGLYMYGRLPDWALTTVPEIARQLSPESRLYPNPKNLYVRLLAETGIAGLVALLAFQLYLLGETLAAFQRKGPVWRYVGIAALCTFVALLLYNMTQDSFATPNLWINLGILAGMSGAKTNLGNGTA
ncbi:MAG TPA: O-antigen ligase family protein [Anaerolineales bacterium]|nr:O-antigen ligase family protein [Anaerolineales bacterium]